MHIGLRRNDNDKEFENKSNSAYSTSWLFVQMAFHVGAVDHSWMRDDLAAGGHGLPAARMESTARGREDRVGEGRAQMRVRHAERRVRCQH